MIFLSTACNVIQLQKRHVNCVLKVEGKVDLLLSQSVKAYLYNFSSTSNIHALC